MMVSNYFKWLDIYTYIIGKTKMAKILGGDRKSLY